MAARAIDSLVRDRFKEFQAEVQKRCTQSTPPVRSRTLGALPTANAEPSPKGSFMRDFFSDVSIIQTWLNQGRGNVKRMGEVLEEAMQATSQDKQKAVSDHLQTLVQETNCHLANVKDGLQKLATKSEEEEKRRPNAAEGKIRRNMQQALAKKQQQLLLDFQKAQVDFKHELERRQHREMELLMPEATPEERAKAIEDGETTQLVVAKKMAGAHALVLDEVDRIREKRQDILRLEQSIADLAQMFTEIATLVDAQGDMLDTIEAHVEKTVGYTAKAEQELITTRKKQRNTQKWMCCLSVFLMVVMICIIAPVLIK